MMAMATGSEQHLWHVEEFRRNFDRHVVAREWSNGMILAV